MKLKYCIITLATLLCRESKAQAINAWNNPVQNGIKALHVGDQVPAVKIADIYNGEKHTDSTVSFNDRLVIFDFGNTHCGGCVEALPHMDSLQKQFGKKVRIFWVTYEPENDVAAFWKSNHLTKDLSIETICADSTLTAYFRHKTWPHEAWVYKGKLVAVTGPEHVDATSIQEILDGKKISWPVKDDFYIFNGNETPLFSLNTEQGDAGSNPLKYAAISDYKEKVNADGMSGGSGIVRDSLKKTIRSFFLNQPVYNSYLLLYIKLIKPQQLIKPSSLGVGPNEVIWEVADKSRYKYDKNQGYVQDWLRKYAICYESLNPDTGQTDSALTVMMIGDLNRLLGLNVHWEKRKEKVLVLVRNDHSINTPVQPENNGIQAANIAYALNQQATNPYVFDETNDSGEHPGPDIKDWTNIPQIRESIKPYGLALREEERMVDRLVFSEIIGQAVFAGKTANKGAAQQDKP